MKSSSRWILCFACVIVGALEAPRALRVLSEDLRGPYQRGTSAQAVVAGPVARHVVGREHAEGNSDALRGSAAVVTLPIRR
jgi:hypothetical protein